MSEIEQIDLNKVPPRWFFLKITTSDGIDGWGEPIYLQKGHVWRNEDGSITES